MKLSRLAALGAALCLSTASAALAGPPTISGLKVTDSAGTVQQACSIANAATLMNCSATMGWDYGGGAPVPVAADPTTHGLYDISLGRKDITADGAFYGSVSSNGLIFAIPLDNGQNGMFGGWGSMLWTFNNLTGNTQQDEFVGSTNYNACQGTITATTTGSTLTPTGASANNPNIASCLVSGPGISGSVTITAPNSANYGSYALSSAVGTAESTAQTFNLAPTYFPIQAMTASGLPVTSSVVQPSLSFDGAYRLDVSGLQAVGLVSSSGMSGGFGYSYTLSAASSPLPYVPDGANVALGKTGDGACGPATMPCALTGRVSYVGADLDKLLAGQSAPLPIVPTASATTHTSVSTGSTAGTFVPALAASAARRECVITDNGTAPILLDVGASPATATAITVQPGTSWRCSSVGVVMGDLISVAPTGSAAQPVSVWGY